jgi:hypothetical protein
MLPRLLAILGYIVGAVIIIGGTVLLIAYGKGYSYDFNTGRLLHRGLVLLESAPSNAQITLGNKVLKQKTPYRQTFEGGEYDFTVAKDGFRTWHKRIEVIPAQVSLVQYLLLLPQHFQVDSVATYPAISQALASRDRHRLGFVVPSGPTAGVWSLDTGNREQTRLYIPPTAVAGQPAEQLQIVSWSDDASHTLVKRTAGTAISYLVLAANGSDPVIDLATAFPGVDFATADFNPSNWRELYWISPEGLRRVDVTTKAVSQPFAQKLATFGFAGDRVLFVDTSQPVASLWSLDRGGHTQRLVPELAPSVSYSLAFSTYIGTPQAVVVAPDSHNVTLYTDIYNQGKVTAKTIDVSASRASFNGDGRFVLLSDDAHVSTYDLERSKIYRFPEINSKVTGLSWFDTYHVQFNRGGQIVLAEFDANYAIAITRGDGLAPFNSSDNKYVFATAPTSSGTTQLKALKIRP